MVNLDEVLKKGRWYPGQPPMLAGESDEQYTNRLTGADQTNRRPYDHSRNRQCSIGWHEECSDRANSGECECPHHKVVRDALALVGAWNEQHPIGTRVTLPLAPEEPATVTTSVAYVAARPGSSLRWPMVDLQGFEGPVELSWLAPAGGR
jgi:hypothetical protein